MKCCNYPCDCDCGCTSKKQSGTVCAMLTTILMVLIIMLTLPDTAFAGIFSTEVQLVPVKGAVTFNGISAVKNITFTPPDTLTIGANADGTYEVTYLVNLVGAPDESIPAPDPAAPATPGSSAPSPATPATPATPARHKRDPVFGIYVNGLAQPSTQQGAILLDGANEQVGGTSIITIPARASVTLRSLGPDLGILGNNTGGVSIVSATLNLQKLGK